MATTGGLTDGQRGSGASARLPRSSAPGPMRRFRVVWLSPDGAGTEPGELDRGAAIGYAQALQHRSSVSGAAGPVYEVLDAAGDPVWRGDPAGAAQALHPRTAERFCTPPGESRDEAA